MIRSNWWPIIITVSAIAAGLAMISDTEASIRPVITFWFLLVCPGMAFVRLLHIEEYLTELTLAIALSIAINTIISEAMVLAKIWSPKGGLIVLILLSFTGVFLQIINNPHLKVQKLPNSTSTKVN